MRNFELSFEFASVMVNSPWFEFPDISSPLSEIRPRRSGKLLKTHIWYILNHFGNFCWVIGAKWPPWLCFPCQSTLSKITAGSVYVLSSGCHLHGSYYGGCVFLWWYHKLFQHSSQHIDRRAEQFWNIRPILANY